MEIIENDNNVTQEGFIQDFFTQKYSEYFVEKYSKYFVNIYKEWLEEYFKDISDICDIKIGALATPNIGEELVENEYMSFEEWVKREYGNKRLENMVKNKIREALSNKYMEK